MSDTEVPFGDDISDQAVLLLAAAQELDLPAEVVRTGSAVFIAPDEVVERAFGNRDKAPQKKAESPRLHTVKSEPAKRATKKAPAKKATTKKAQE